MAWNQIYLFVVVIIVASMFGRLSRLTDEVRTVKKAVERVEAMVKVSSPMTRPEAKITVTSMLRQSNGSHLTISASQDVLVLRGMCAVGKELPLTVHKLSDSTNKLDPSKTLTNANLMFKHPPLPHATIDQSVSEDGSHTTLVMKNLVPPGISLRKMSSVERTFPVTLTCQWLDYQHTAQLTIEMVPKYTPGIDLGTHNICAAYVNENSEVKLIDLTPDEDGFCIPSAPWICERGIFLGEKVPSNMDQGCERVYDVKRKLGDFCRLGDIDNDDITVKPTCVAGEGCELTVLPFLCKGTKRQIESELVLGVTARILIQRIKQQLNVQHLEGLAFTFPPEFPASQRAAFFDAIRLANEGVELTWSEPLAAVVESQYKKTFSKAKVVLVLDLGHGTIGIQLVEVHPEGHIRALFTAGFGNRGGRDLDIAFAEHINRRLKELKYKWTVSPQNAETFKIRLSKQKDITVKRDCVIRGECKDQITVTQSELNTVCADMFGKILPDEIDRVFPETNLNYKKQYRAGGKYSYANLNEVLVVGGASRAPCLRNILVQHFKKHGVTETGQPHLKFIADASSRDPKVVVALGAAIQAARLTGMLDGGAGIRRSTHSAILARDLNNKCTEVIPSQQAMDGLRLKPIQIPLKVKLINGRRCVELSFCELSYSLETENKNVSCDCEELKFADKQTVCDDNIPKGLLKANPPAVMGELVGMVQRNGSLLVEVTGLRTMTGSEISGKDGKVVASKAFSYDAGHFDRKKLDQLRKLAGEIQEGQYSCQQLAKADDVHGGRFCDTSPDRLMKLSVNCGEKDGKALVKEDRFSRVLTVQGISTACKLKASLRHSDATTLALSAIVIVFEKHSHTHMIAETVKKELTNAELSPNLYLGVIAISRTTEEVFKLSRMTSVGIENLNAAMEQTLLQITDHSVDLPVRFGEAIQMVEHWFASVPDALRQAPLTIVHITAGSPDLPLDQLDEEKSEMWSIVDGFAEEYAPSMRMHHLLFHPEKNTKQLKEVEVLLTTKGKLKDRSSTFLSVSHSVFQNKFAQLLNLYRTAVASELKMNLNTTVPKWKTALKIKLTSSDVIESSKLIEGTNTIVWKKDHILHTSNSKEDQAKGEILVKFHTPQDVEEGMDLFSVQLEWFDIAEGKVDQEEKWLVKVQRKQEH